NSSVYNHCGSYLPPESDRSEPNLAQGFQTFSQDPKTLDESLALIFGDLSPSSASAHMNYLITLLKSVSLCCLTD
ncbi:hypothetical protein, partial [Vreelandella subterranea]|uniref:hypothetical protein n=1 Tax=Vreelandella subterranea TaxID=416874 RepID=UPI001C319DCD